MAFALTISLLHVSNRSQIFAAQLFGYLPIGKNDLVILHLVTGETSTSSVERVSSSCQETGYTDAACSATRDGDPMRLKCSVHTTPSGSGLEPCEVCFRIIDGCVHETEVECYSIVDVVGASPGCMTTTSHGKFAVALRTQCFDGSRYFFSRYWLNNTLGMQLSAHGPVRRRPILVLLVILVKDVC